MNFTIKKGRHYSLSNWWKRLWIGKPILMGYSVSFDDACYVDNGNQIDKVFGFSKGWHWKNSARVGRKYNEKSGEIDLLAYCHMDGIEYSTANLGNIYLCSVAKGQTSPKITISTMGNSAYNFKVGASAQIQIPMGATAKKWGYHLFPFIGGTEPAVQTQKFTLI